MNLSLLRSVDGVATSGEECRSLSLELCNARSDQVPCVAATRLERNIEGEQTLVW